MAPAIRTWTGLGADDLWSNAANWDTGVPGDGDDVRIAATTESAEVLFDPSVAGGGVTINSLTSDGTNPIGEPLRITGDTLILSGAAGAGPFAVGAGLTVSRLSPQIIGVFAAESALAVDALTLSGGIFTGSGAVAIGTSLNWTSGTMAGSGTTTIPAGVTATLSGSSLKILGRTLQNQGIINYTGSIFRFGTAPEVGTLNNEGVFNITGGGALQQTGVNAPHAFNNSGTLNRSGAGLSQIESISFNNTGTVNVLEGTLRLDGGGSSTGGTFAVAGGAVLQFNSNYTLDAATTVSGAGAGSFTAGTVTVDGAYTLTGPTTVSAVVGFNTATSFPTLNLTAGTLGGSGNITISAALNWTRGHMAGSGTTTILPGATTTLSDGQGSGFKDLGRTLVNQGTINYTGSLLRFGPGAGVLSNDGVFNATGDGDLALNFANPGHAFSNAGTFNRSGTGATIIDGISFSNSGTVNVQEGTLNLNSGLSNFSGGTLTGGTYNVTGILKFAGANIVTNAATIVLDGGGSQIVNQANADALAGFTTNGAAGSFTIRNGRQFTAAAAFSNAGNVSIGLDSAFRITSGGSSTGDWAIAGGGVLEFGGGTYLLDGGSDITGAGLADIAGGTVNVGDAAADNASAVNVVLESGTLGGLGAWTVAGVFDWTGGSMADAGALVMAAGAALNIAASETYEMNAHNLINNGTASLGAAALNGTGLFTNSGTLNLASATLNVPLHNEGTVQAQGNSTSTISAPLTAPPSSIFRVAPTASTQTTLTVANGFTNHGLIELTGADNAFAVFTLAAGTLLNTGTIQALAGGAGGARTINAQIDNQGTIDAAKNLTINNAGKTFTTTAGTLNTAAGVVLSINGGTSRLGAATALTGAGTLDFAGTHALELVSDRTLTAAGVQITLSGSVTVAGPGTLINQQPTLELGFDTIDANLVNQSLIEVRVAGGSQTSAINGTLTTTAGSTLRIFAKFSNNSFLTVANGFTNHGVIELTGEENSDARLTVASGTLTNAAAGAIRALPGGGPGFRRLIAALNNQGTLDVQHKLTVEGAAVLSNAGNVTIGPGSTLETGADYVQTGGSTTLAAASSVLDPGGIVDIQGGSLGGFGSVLANVQNAGQVNPGTSPGTLTNNGSYTQNGGALNIELGGLAAGTQYDQLVVTGNVNLNGALHVSLTGGFVPATGDSFHIIDHTGAGAIGGAFTGVPEGTILTVGSAKFHVSYAGGTGNDVVLTAVNLEPTLDAIADPAAILEDAGQQTVNLSGISAGGSDAQTLTVTATSSNPALIPDPTVSYTSANATGSLAYTPVSNQSGTAIITVTVQDSGGTTNGGDDTITRTFTVTVNAVNDAPTVAAPIADLTVSEDAAPVLDHASLDAVFADVDNLDAELTYAVTATTPGGIVAAAIDAGDALDLSFLADAFGDVEITVRATDPDGLFAEDTFHVAVTPINDAPTVANPIADRIVPTSAAPVLNHADLNTVFADVDDLDAELVYTIFANNNSALVSAIIEADDSLDLSFTAGQNGIADITIRAADPDGSFVEDSFRVTVKPPVATTTVITLSSPGPSSFGQPVTFTVTVTPGEGSDLPTGTLTFQEGGATLGTSTPLIDVGGVATATFTTTATQLGGGSHAITASYPGADAFVASASADFIHTVNPAATAVVITAATPSPSIVGQTVTFTVTVAPGVGGVLPTGTLTFMDGAVALGASTALLDVGGLATATFTTTAGQLGVGARAITAVYAGDANFAAATSAVFAHTVNPLTAVPDAYNAKRSRKLKVAALSGLLANDQHVSGQALLVKKPAKGKLTLKADGSFTYVPASGFVGKVTFKYRVANAFGVSAPVVVTIKVRK